MALGSFIFIQIGLALSIGLVDRLGTNGAGWIRMGWAGLLMLLVFARPRRARFTRRAVVACFVLGVVTVGITLIFQAALARIPLGTACALNFIGPLGLAVVVDRPRRFVWPVVAAIGVLLLTQPWDGAIDPLGVLYAVGAGGLWALYIVQTQRVGDEVAGIDGLALSMVVSGVVSTVIVGPTVIPRLTPELILIGLGIAVLCPVLPFLLEFFALRRLTAGAFGMLMAVEPAFAMLAGLVMLDQVPDVGEAFGIGLVIVAGIGAARAGARMESLVAPIVGSR
ncbi:MAG: inner rane transporter RhtA [Mycobacterium sp.]|jgi:inner membrane transporter RhtA|nr:inner rane transporter RhtA [Mycobacterium sp.]